MYFWFLVLNSVTWAIFNNGFMYLWMSSIWVPSGFNFFSYIIYGFMAKAFKFLSFFFFFFFFGFWVYSLFTHYTQCWIWTLKFCRLSNIHTYPFQEMVIWVFIPLLNIVSLFSFMATSLVLLFHFSFSAWKGELFPIWVSISVVKIAIFSCRFTCQLLFGK